MPTMTFNHSDAEQRAMEAMCAESELSKTALLRQALRLYQLVHTRAKDGQQMAFVKDGKVIPMFVPTMLLPPEEPA